MKLYDVPRNTRIRVIDANPASPPASIQIRHGQELNFKHIDGMYSFCRDDAGNIVHLVAWAEVEIVT